MLKSIKISALALAACAALVSSATLSSHAAAPAPTTSHNYGFTYHWVGAYAAPSQSMSAEFYAEPESVTTPGGHSLTEIYSGNTALDVEIGVISYEGLAPSVFVSSWRGGVWQGYSTGFHWAGKPGRVPLGRYSSYGYAFTANRVSLSYGGRTIGYYSAPSSWSPTVTEVYGELAGNGTLAGKVQGCSQSLSQFYAYAPYRYYDASDTGFAFGPG